MMGSAPRGGKAGSPCTPRAFLNRRDALAKMVEKSNRQEMNGHATYPHRSSVIDLGRGDG